MKKDYFDGVYEGKRVLVIGHTGFKGSWLSLWLSQLGAECTGFSKYLPSDPCHFRAIELEKHLTHYEGDVRSLDELAEVFDKVKPEIVFHLAAQPIVMESYRNPKKTFDTNLGGTVNVLECIRLAKSVLSAVIITSDKCYENDGRKDGYHEEDRLGGADPYSASKACAEIAFSAYFRSFFNNKISPGLATTRAGNVIGGGDWANDRIVPDCVRAWSMGKTPLIRKPEATRPWQHVLEPVSGYLWLGAKLLADDNKISGESYNFGPNPNEVKSVEDLVSSLAEHWEGVAWEKIKESGNNHEEAVLLQLSHEKASKHLGWQPVLDFGETTDLTARWYKQYFQEGNDAYALSRSQIDEYVNKASERNIVWASPAGKATTSKINL